MNIGDSGLKQVNYNEGTQASPNRMPVAGEEQKSAKIDTGDKFKTGEAGTEKIITKKEAKALKLIQKEGKKEVNYLKRRNSMTWAIASSPIFPLNMIASMGGLCGSLEDSPALVKEQYENFHADTQKFFQEHNEAESMAHLNRIDPDIHDKVNGQSIAGKAFDKIREALTPLPKGTPEDEQAGKKVITKDENKLLKMLKRATRSHLTNGIFSGDYGDGTPGLLMAGGLLLTVAGIVGASPAILFGVGFGIAGGVGVGKRLKENMEWKKDLDTKWEDRFIKSPQERSIDSFHDSFQFKGSRRGKIEFNKYYDR